MKSKKSASLEFESCYTVKGLYIDPNGNEFTIYISGQNEDVDEFVRYQESQKAKGIIGISATVMADDSGESTIVKQKMSQSKVEFKSGKVKIGISRYKIKMKSPYKIIYHIDPHIKTEPTSVAPGKIIPAVPDFEFEFDNQTADVTCSVLEGAVEFALFEVNKSKSTIDPISLDDSPNHNIGHLIAKSNSPNQKWRVLATGKRPGKDSVFTLDYTKKY